MKKKIIDSLIILFWLSLIYGCFSLLNWSVNPRQWDPFFQCVAVGGVLTFVGLIVIKLGEHIDKIW